MKNSNLNKFFILAGFIFLISNVYANCDERQIDINSASKTELDKLIGIGPAKATEIINSRPFESLDDLLNVNGIGETTLQNIKDQRLACIKIESKTSDEEIKSEKEQSIDEENNKEELPEKIDLIQETPSEIQTMEVIKLDSKSIKSQTNSGNLTKRYATYGLIFFCILLLVLFIIKWKEIFPKNEFK